MKRLKLGNLDEPISIILHGFGECLGMVLVGKVVNLSKRNVTVLVRDGGEEYREVYSRQDGIRLSDKDQDSGWQIQLSDLVNKPSPVNDPASFQSSLDRVKKLHREEHPISDDEKLVVEVWHDEKIDERYAKFYREPIDGGRQKCFLVPFDLIKRVLADHEVTWEIQQDG